MKDYQGMTKFGVYGEVVPRMEWSNGKDDLEGKPPRQLKILALRLRPRGVINVLNFRFLFRISKKQKERYSSFLGVCSFVI